jgi:YidC/Oxa1 family membrane protein insertase
LNTIVLTQSGGLLGPIAKYILGPILKWIFDFLDWLPWENSANVGVAIIIFTLVVYIALLPLTIKQQKFSKLQAKMQPEIQKIQEKYKNKKDQDSQMAMNQETQEVYRKYGVSPMGSCLQLLIQMPILIALYRVIYSIPAYVPMIKNAFTGLVDSLMAKEGATEFLSNLTSGRGFAKQFSNELFLAGDPTYVQNTYIDVLNRASKADWASLSEKFPDLSSVIDSTMSTLDKYNNFLGINISYSPWEIIKPAFQNHAYLLVLGAILIPVLSAVTQWINIKLTPTPSNDKKGEQDPTAATMKSMNLFMPIFSAFMCFTLPSGMGIYWIAGAVIRSIEQVLINKHIDKMDLEAEIKKNVEKRNARLRKAGIDPEKLAQNASISTKSMAKKPTISQKAAMANGKSVNEDKIASTEYNNKNVAKPGSLAAKANMVKEYNERNNK